METFVLLKFRDLKEVGRYIQVVYLEYIDFQQAYFQVQFIVATEANNIFIIIRHSTINRVTYERNMVNEKQSRRL